MYFRYMLYTVGYGGFSPEEFLHALRSRGVEVLADVRRFPRSKTGFYSGEKLREALQRVGEGYVWFGELGALGVRGPGAGCAASKTFDAYVWRLYHYAPALLQLEELEQLARRRTVALMCREEDWRHCHRQFLADFFARRGFEVIHIRRRGEERHIPTACFNSYDPPPIDLIKRVYTDFSRLCGGASIYLFGGALDGTTHDIDVVAYGAAEDLPESYDAQALPKPADDLFHYFVTHWGILLCGRPLEVDFHAAFRNEAAETETRLRRFREAEDPVVVCKAAKQLVFAMAVALCGARNAYTWRRAVACLGAHGLEVPSAFKNCLSPPPIEELRKHELLVARLAEIVREVLG